LPTKLGFEEMIQILTKAGYEIRKDYFRHRRINSSCYGFSKALHGKINLHLEAEKRKYQVYTQLNGKSKALSKYIIR